MIILLILGAILFTRLAVWVRGRIMARIDAHAARPSPSTSTPASGPPPSGASPSSSPP